MKRQGRPPQISYLQIRIDEVSIEAQTNPRLWPVVNALKSTLDALKHAAACAQIVRVRS